MKKFLSKFFGFGRKSDETDVFSRFFREASTAEKERVIGEAIRKSTEDQCALISAHNAH